MPVPDSAERDLDKAAGFLAKSRRALFITGAGVSADSGLPTYRGIGGLYNVDETEDGLPIEEALSGTMLQLRPELTWKYLGQIERSCRGARFNRAHEVIARLESRLERVCVFTQNIDGFHRQAGSSDVLEIHGDLHDLACTSCPSRRTVADYAGLELPPVCPDCGAPMRPAVVLFGEALPQETLARFYERWQDGFDAVFSVGTTSVFPYIAQPVLLARRQGIPTVEINPGESQVSERVDVRLRLGAAEALQGIGQRLGLKATKEEA